MKPRASFLLSLLLGVALGACALPDRNRIVVIPPSATPLPPADAAVLSMPDLDNRGFRLAAKTQDALRRRIAQYLDALQTTYKAGDKQSYVATTYRWLQFSDEVPGYALEVAHGAILKAAAQGQWHSQPVIIEYANRLMRTNTKSARVRYAQLRSIMAKRPLKISRQWPVLVRRSDNGSVTALTARETAVLTSLLFSTAGQALGRERAATSEDLMRIAAMAASCKDKDEERTDDSEGGRSAFSRLTEIRTLSTCPLYLARLRDLMNDGKGPADFDDLLGHIDGVVSNGASSNAKACVAELRDTTLSDATQRLDDYMACRTRMASPASAGFDIMMMLVETTGSYGNFERYFHEDGRPAGAEWSDLPDGQGGTMRLKHDQGTFDLPGVGRVNGNGYFEERKDAAGNVTYQSGEIVGTTESGERYVATEERTYNPQTGERTHSHSVHVEGVGSASSTTKEGPSGKTTTTKITIEYDDGSTETWETTVDENGKVTEKHSTTPPAETGAATPVGDTVPDPCGGILYEEPRRRTTVTNLETLIVPSPDDPDMGSAAIPEACLLGNGQTPGRCFSVWLCQEGQSVDENCRCAWPGGTRPDLPAHSGSCQHIQCPDGTICDPEMGVCKSTGGDLAPGNGAAPPPMPFFQAPGATAAPAVSRLRYERMFDAILDLHRNFSNRHLIAPHGMPNPAPGNWD